MAQHKDTTELTGLLFQWMGLADPMLGMLEWVVRTDDGSGGFQPTGRTEA